MRNTVKLPVASLKPFDDNPKIHPQDQIDTIVRSIEQFGFINPILVDENNMILGGHGRLMAAKALGMTEVECLVVPGLTDAMKRAYVVADNKIGTLGDWDESLLHKIITSLEDEPDLLTSLGFSETELEYLSYTDDLADMPTMEDEVDDELTLDKLEKATMSADPKTTKGPETKYAILLEFDHLADREAALVMLEGWSSHFTSFKYRASNY